MSTVTIAGIVGQDHKLVIDVPVEIPPGPVSVVIQPVAPIPPSTGTLTREEARARLLAAGMLVTEFNIPPDAHPLTREERRRLGTLPPGARSSEELIDEDRGPH
jgi:hypothetical protein